MSTDTKQRILVSIPDKGNQQERGKGRTTTQRESLQDANQAEKSHTLEGATRRRQLVAGGQGLPGARARRRGGGARTSARYHISPSVPRALFLHVWITFHIIFYK